MKIEFKRVQLIYRTKDGEYKKVWQNIDPRKMITFEHVWKDIKQQLDWSASDDKCLFYFYKTKQVLPVWYHVDLLNDNDQILIESVPSDKPTMASTSVCLKKTSKKKQLNTYLTNRSFIITDKYSIPNTFYQQWEEGKMHKNTNNCQMIF